MSNFRCVRAVCSWAGELPHSAGSGLFCPNCLAPVVKDPVVVAAKCGDKEKSDGLTAHYYELPEAATELYHLITYKNMNAQIGEIFRACYRYGEVEHSAKLRDVNKMLAYATQEKERLLKYELSNNEE